MITLDNLRQLLDHLGFTRSGQRYGKPIGDTETIKQRAISANALIAAAPARKQAILESYL